MTIEKVISIAIILVSIIVFFILLLNNEYRKHRPHDSEKTPNIEPEIEKEDEDDDEDDDNFNYTTTNTATEGFSIFSCLGSVILAIFTIYLVYTAITSTALTYEYGLNNTSNPYITTDLTIIAGKAITQLKVYLPIIVLLIMATFAISIIKKVKYTKER